MISVGILRKEKDSVEAHNLNCAGSIPASASTIRNFMK